VDRFGDFESGIAETLCEGEYVVSPQTEPEPVEQSLQSQLSRLLGREASPVVKPILSGELPVAKRAGCLGAPPFALLAIERPLHRRGR
jgi:hypothetical protein